MNDKQHISLFCITKELVWKFQNDPFSPLNWAQLASLCYIADKTQYFKDKAFRLIMVSKGDCQVKRAGKIKERCSNLWLRLYGRNIYSVSCAPIVTELIYGNFLSVCLFRIMLRK